MIGHDDCRVQEDALAVIVEAMLENGTADGFGKGLPSQLAESHKDRSTRLLIVRQHAAILVLSVKSTSLGHVAIQVKEARRCL